MIYIRASKKIFCLAPKDVCLKLFIAPVMPVILYISRKTMNCRKTNFVIKKAKIKPDTAGMKMADITVEIIDVCKIFLFNLAF